MLDIGCSTISKSKVSNMSYRNLEIWRLARDLTIDIHRMTIHDLPKFEMYEEGSQIRREIKSVRSNIVEGYGRRNHKQEFIRFLTFALASNDEATDHLETLFETESLRDKELFHNLRDRLEVLGRKLNSFRRSVGVRHRPTSSLQHPESNI